MLKVTTFKPSDGIPWPATKGFEVKV